MTTLSQLDRFIPLSQAAKRLGITADLLRKQIENGSVTAIVLNDTLAVAERDLIKVIPITRDQFFLNYGANRSRSVPLSSNMALTM